MNITSFNDKFPIYSIFFYFLIIVAGLTVNTFPCKMRYALDNNLYLKHFIGFLTMVFLVVVAEPYPDQKLLHIFPIAALLYIVFILISKTEYPFFLAILVILGLEFAVILTKTEFKKDLKEHPEKEKELQPKINTAVFIGNTVMVAVIILTIIGVLAYMGRKKYEYKDKFNYFTFFLGKIDCKYSKPKIGIMNSFKHL